MTRVYGRKHRWGARWPDVFIRRFALTTAYYQGIKAMRFVVLKSRWQPRNQNLAKYGVERWAILGKCGLGDELYCILAGPDLPEPRSSDEVIMISSLRDLPFVKAQAVVNLLGRL